MTGPGELIRRRRHLVTILLRSTCVVLIAMGAVGVLANLGVVAWAGRWAVTDYETVSRLCLSVTYIVVGLCLALIQKRLVKWLVPVMRPACPNCGYALRDTARVCSECGFALEQDDGGRRASGNRGS